MTKEFFGKRNWFVLLLFGLIGQIAWSVENMYFNLFVFETIAPSLDTVTLMVQLSGIMATVATLVAGAFSDRSGNRRHYISIGYIIWGVTVALFGFISPELIQKLFNTPLEKAISIALVTVVVGDCIMTLFGSTANDACFNAWVTDNTKTSFRGSVEGVLSILPLLAMLIVAGGFGILVSVMGYQWLFACLGVIISLCGVIGIWTIRDSNNLTKNGTIKDIFYGLKLSVVKANPRFYLTLVIVMIYGIACQIFMPYLIIYMKTYLGFTVLEYSIVFGAAIIFGAIINVFLGKLSDKKNKYSMLYIACAVMSIGLFGMYVFKSGEKLALMLTFGIAGFVMITGYIFVTALCGSIVRDNTPAGSVGKLQGVRMIFSVLIPMLIGPMIGNAINKAKNIPLPDMNSADVMTTQYIPAPQIFLVGAVVSLVMFAFIPILNNLSKKVKKNDA
jgi:MFS family permease